VVVAICTLLGKGNNKITDQFSAYEKGLVLYYYYPILVIFGFKFLASCCILAGISIVFGYYAAYAISARHVLLFAFAGALCETVFRSFCRYVLLVAASLYLMSAYAIFSVFFLYSL